MAGAVAAGLLLTGCDAGGAAHRTSPVPVGTFALVGFGSCADLLAGLRAAANARVTAYGLGGATPVFAGGGPVPDAVAAGSGTNAGGPVAGRADAAGGTSADAASTPAYSGTNTAEPGVDEPDLVKTDGHRIVVISDGVLRVIDAASRKVTGSLPLGEQNGNGTGTGSIGGFDDIGYGSGGDAGLLLAGDRALVFTRTGGIDDITGPALLLVDLAGQPRIVGSYAIDGNLVDARQVGATVRVVVRSAPRINFPRLDNATDAQRLAANHAAIDKSGPADWLPGYAVTTGGKTTRGTVPCDAVSRPAEYSGSSMLTVLTFPLGTGSKGTGATGTAPTGTASLGTGNPVTVVADGTTVYSNGSSLYVAGDNRWRLMQPMIALPSGGPSVRPSPPQQRTELYQFDTAGTGRPGFVGAGSVPGYLINQYALSDWGGNLRVATTEGDSSAVYVLHRSGSALRTIGKVGGLGKGERIYAVRFDAGIGYVVTYRQTDPLYAVDLRDPAHPSLSGSLDIDGYSAYLHPIDGDRLIGVGQAAGPDGRIQGAAVSLFDVSNPAAPKRLTQYRVRYGHSTAEFDPHAFLYWPATGLLVLPMTTVNVGPLQKPRGPMPPVAKQTAGAVTLHVTANAIRALATGSVSHENQPISRSLVVDRTLWTVSANGLAAYDLSSLAAQAWLPY
ncbi:beta-propeller domain-containing protein [Rugosimonospora africana]|nr:beta-propeller domain-containing protein [Rugosimonospora africana]